MSEAEKAAAKKAKAKRKQVPYVLKKFRLPSFIYSLLCEFYVK
jgi:hypothetical protein